MYELGASWRDKIFITYFIEKQLDAAVSCIWSRLWVSKQHPEF